MRPTRRRADPNPALRPSLASHRPSTHDCRVARFLRYFGLGFLVFLAISIVVFLSYYLPSTEQVHVTGTEVKRVDVANEDGSARTRDVRFIVTKAIDDGRTLVFRNEDTGWGWPLYFKFNSGDIMGEAVNFHEAEVKETVLVSYYGWRLTFLDLYPNVLALKAVPPDYVHIPVFNIVIIALLLGLFGFLALRVRRFMTRARAKREDSSPS